MRPDCRRPHDASKGNQSEEGITMGTAEMQDRLWGPGARDWSELNEPSCVPFYDAVFDAIAVRPGTALLDAGCGGGFALQLAAKRGATVTGFDACGPLLDSARERVPDADLRQGDLESLPFAEHTFDAVTAFNSIQFASDLIAVMRELRRVARPGAPVAILIWGAPERCESRVILAAPARCRGTVRAERAGEAGGAGREGGSCPGAGGRSAYPAHLSRPGHRRAHSAVLRPGAHGHRACRRAGYPEHTGRGLRRQPPA